MFKKLFLICIIFFFLTNTIFLNASPVFVKEFMDSHKDEILKIDREENMKNYFHTHLLGNYGDVANVVGFTDALTSGVYLKEINYILKEKILEVRIDARTLKSVDKMKIHLTRIKQAQPLTVNINDAMTKIGYYVTAATIASQVYKAFQGDDAAKREAVSTAFSAELGWIVNKIGSTSLSVSMAGVQFIDYALKKFITAQYDQYNEFWWNAYSAYYNQKYRALVTGTGSWASLIETSGPQVIEARLNEFWQNPLENAAVYYKMPSPFQRDALASAEFKKPFAGRYYKDYLQTTLETYFSRKAAEEADAGLKAADAEYKKVIEFIEEMRVLQEIIKETAEELNEGKPPLPKMEIFKAALDDYNGREFIPPAQNGDNLFFTAKVEYPEGKPYPAFLLWNFEDEDGAGVTSGTSREVSEAGVAKGYGYRIKLNNVKDGQYKVVLIYHSLSDSSHFASAIYPVEVFQRVKIDKLVVTGNKDDLTNKKSFEPENDLYFFAYYTLNKGVRDAKLTLNIKNLTTGELIKTFNTDVSAGNTEISSFATEMSLQSGTVKIGEEAVFEAVIVSVDGKQDAMETKFNIEPYKLILNIPSELKSGRSAEFSIKVPEKFKPPYTVNINPSGGLNIGHIPGRLTGTVGAIALTESTGKLTVNVKDADNRTAETSGTIRITLPYSPALLSPPPSAPSTLNISGNWNIKTISSKSGQTTDYSMTISGSGSSYSGTIRRLGPNPYSWHANVTLNPATGELSYTITLGTKPPFIRLVHTGKVAAGGRSANGTYRRDGGSGTAWSGTWSAVKE